MEGSAATLAAQSNAEPWVIEPRRLLAQFEAAAASSGTSERQASTSPRRGPSLWQLLDRKRRRLSHKQPPPPAWFTWIAEKAAAASITAADAHTTTDAPDLGSAPVAFDEQVPRRRRWRATRISDSLEPPALARDAPDDQASSTTEEEVVEDFEWVKNYDPKSMDIKVQRVFAKRVHAKAHHNVDDVSTHCTDEVRARMRSEAASRALRRWKDVFSIPW